MAGESIRKEIHQELTYKDLDKNIDKMMERFMKGGVCYESQFPTWL